MKKVIGMIVFILLFLIVIIYNEIDKPKIYKSVIVFSTIPESLTLYQELKKFYLLDSFLGLLNQSYLVTLGGGFIFNINDLHQYLVNKISCDEVIKKYISTIKKRISTANNEVGIPYLEIDRSSKKIIISIIGTEKEILKESLYTYLEIAINHTNVFVFETFYKRLLKSKDILKAEILKNHLLSKKIIPKKFNKKTFILLPTINLKISTSYVQDIETALAFFEKSIDTIEKDKQSYIEKGELVKDYLKNTLEDISPSLLSRILVIILSFSAAMFIAFVLFLKN